MKLIETIRQEPVLFQALMQAALALLLSFGLKLNSTQVGAILAFSAAVLSFWTRTQVTPSSNPTNNNGVRLLPDTLGAATTIK